MNKKRKVCFGLIVILAVGVILIINARKNKSSGEIVTEVTPSYGAIEVFITTTGVVEPQNRLEIKPPISGRIERILVKEGQKVKTGEVLAWMSSTERAALIDAAVSQGEEAVRHWQEVYKPAPLIAPIDGDVIVREVEPGRTVTASDVILVLSDRLIVKAQVDETDIGKVKIGQNARISLDAYPQVKVNATVDHISYESQTVNNVTIYEVDILPDMVPEVFRSGMSAEVNIIEDSKKDILTLPAEAVKSDNEGSYVLLSRGRDKEAVIQRVKIGITDGKNTEIISGLDEHAKVIMKGFQYMLPQDGENKSNPLMPFGGRRSKRK